MEENKDNKKNLACPFCGAPPKDVIPINVAQVKCEYCGSIFPVSPYLKDSVSRCPNHPEAFATGLCNDCSGNFCTRCLSDYHLKTDGASARLYLCPDCLRGRHLKQANGYIFLGIILLFSEIFVLFAPNMGVVVLGTLFILSFSIPFIAYGLYKRSTLVEEPKVHDKREPTPESKELFELPQDISVDAGALYDKMLGDYMMRWGALNAKEMLDSEIYAHVHHGLSYGEAIFRVARGKGLITAETEAKVRALMRPEKEDKQEDT